MAIKKCKECGGDVSTTATACPHCGSRSVKNNYGCLFAALVVMGIFIVFCFIFGTVPSPSSRLGSGAKKPSIELSKITGTFVSSIDPRWKVQVASAPSSGGAYGGWNGTIRLYGPPRDFDGRPLRCRVFGDMLTVEVVYDGETTIMKMFSILDENFMVSSVSDYWPGTLRRQ